MPHAGKWFERSSSRWHYDNIPTGFPFMYMGSANNGSCSVPSMHGLRFVEETNAPCRKMG